MSGAILPLPNTPSWHGALLKKAQGQLYFSLLTAQDPLPCVYLGSYLVT